MKILKKIYSVTIKLYRKKFLD